MRNKIVILIVLILEALFLTSQIVIGERVQREPAAPSSVCEITANVLDIKKVKTNMKGVGIPPRKDFYYYEVNLDILDISTHRSESFSRPCDNSYIESVKKYGGAILSLKAYNEMPIKKGQKIKALIHFGGDEWFHGYFLSPLQILEEAPINKEKKETNLNYWNYGIFGVLILLAIIFLYIFVYIFKKKKM
jgi:hypothetical protein